MSTFYYVPQYFTTQLSVAGGIDDTQTTGIVLQSITGVDETKPGIIAISWSNPIDTTKVEYITYTSINATTKELQGVTRGEEGYSAKSHVNGATVAWPLSKSHINNIPDSTTTFTNKTLIDASNIISFNSPRGFLINGKIVPSVASNNLTVAIKGLDGNDPSATNPVFCRIGDTIRSITSALSVTKNAGTNWCNSGSAELATKEVDYFVYLGYNTTDGVTLGFSRIPYARTYGAFSTTSTNEKYCAISTITNAVSGNNYENIGRFGATLSAGAGYTWTVPTFTAVNLIQRPIYESRILTCVPQSVSGPVFSVAPSCFYQIRETMIHFNMSFGNFGVTGSGIALYSLPFSVLSNFFAGGASQTSSGIYIDSNGVNFYKAAGAVLWSGGETGNYLYCEMFYPTALS